MADELTPRFQPEDFLPREIDDGLASAFERELAQQVNAEVAHNVVEAVKPLIMAAVFHATAVAIDGLADELEKAEFNCGEPARLGGIQAAMKVAVEHAREKAKFFRSVADKHSPESGA